MTRVLSIITVAALLASSGPALAVQLWDNGDTDGTNGIAHDPSPDFRSVLDDFEVPPGPGWCIDGFRTIGVWDTLPPGQLGDIELVIWSDLNGEPDVMMFEFNVTLPGEFQTGRDWFGRWEVAITAEMDAVCLDPGRYWIEMHVNGNDRFYQMARQQVTGSSIWLREPGHPAYPDPYWGQQAYGIEYDVSFQLFGQVQGINKWGMNHIGLGEAELAINRNGHLVVSNIGSSGKDGVSVDLGQAGGYSLMLSDIAEPLGAFREMSVYGSVDGVENELVLTRRYEVVQARQGNNPGVLRVFQDSGPMGASMFDVKAYDADGNLLHSTQLPNGWLWDVPTFPTHSLCVIVDWTKDGPQDLPSCRDEGDYLGAITFGDNVSVTNVSYIEIQAVDATRQLDYLSRVDDVAAGISQFELMDSKLGQFGNFHLALGDVHFDAGQGPIDHEHLTVSNIGASGDDGVSLCTERRGDPHKTWIELEAVILDIPGGAFELSGQGRENGVGDPIDLGLVGLQTNAVGDVEAYADFAAVGVSMVLVEVYDDGILVGSSVVPGGGTVATLTPPPGGGGAPELIEVEGHISDAAGEAMRAYTWATRFAGDHTVTIIDNERVVGDELHSVALNPPVIVPHWTTWDMRATNIPEFTIIDEILTGSVTPETVCPDDANNFLKPFGGPVTGDALDLCADDNVRLQVQQSAPVTPLLPFIRLEYWANTTLSGDTISQLDYHINCHVSAFVAGGQNPNTLRTSIRNFTANSWSLRDQRATPNNADVDINIVEAANAPDYVNAGDGMIRVRQDVFNPGNVAFPLWFLKVDQYEVTVTP